nr:MAG TPA: DNA binding protein [Caudoviricetes sp.]
MAVIFIPIFRKDDETMAEGVRKRGKTWSYYFDTAKINGERNKIEKGGFRTQKEALDARAAAIAEYNNTGRSFSPKEISVADYLDY